MESPALSESPSSWVITLLKANKSYMAVKRRPKGEDSFDDEEAVDPSDGA